MEAVLVESHSYEGGVAGHKPWDRVTYRQRTHGP